MAPASPPQTLTNVVVLAEDAAMLELLKQALEGRQRIWRAESAAHAADLLVASQGGILFIDAAFMTHETPALVEQVYRQFPDLPIIVAGRRDDEAELGPLISSGQVYRFLHKPVSAERARNFVEAAERRRGEQPAGPAPATEARPASSTPAFALPPIRLEPATIRRMSRIAAALVALGLVIAGVAAVIERRPWQGIELPSLPVPAERAPPVAVAPSQPQAQPSESARLLNAAGVALSQGRLVEPEGQSAVELYRAVLLKDPGNIQAREGLARVSEELLLVVEQALLAQDLLAAASALDAARSADPANPRLEFLSAQLAHERERASQAGTVPASAVAAADRAMNERISRLLTQADERMKQGKLVGNADSAEAYVLSAREARPDDPGVRQALNALSGRMLLSASQALVGGDVATAIGWLDRADTLGVDGEAVARLRAEIESARVASVQEDRSRLLALANQRLAQGRLLEPRADSARHYLDLLRAADPAYEGLGETEALLAERLVESAHTETRAGRFPEAARLLAAAAAAGADPASLGAARSDLEGAQARTRAAGQVLPEAELTPIQHTPAEYPVRAASRGVEGWVEVEFTVSRDGTTRDARVTASTPEGYFEDSVLEAVQSWRYRPHVVGGQPVDQRVQARIRFQLSGG